MENSKDQIMQPLTDSMLNIYNNLKQAELLKKSFTCLECRVTKNSTPVLVKHVQTRHPDKSVQLLAKECSQCDLKFRYRS